MVAQLDYTGGQKVREPQPGDVLGGRYVIDKVLGRGGFGVVFKARHLEIDRAVAVKALLATYASRDHTAVKRFRREAQIAASLHYPNTVQLFDYGETDQGIFYIVMELLNGTPLTDVIDEVGALGHVRAVHITRQVLHSLQEAHAKGIVHRDIKPDNIMITPLAYDADFVKTMDFGIAKMVSSEAPSLTSAGMTLGTPRYMPVEQLRGERLSPATDLYSVGVVLYECLTGKPAIDADSLIEVAAKVLDGESVTLPVDAGVPPILAGIVNKACSKDARDRFQTAYEFLQALDAWQPDVEVLPDMGEVTIDRSVPRQLLGKNVDHALEATEALSVAAARKKVDGLMRTEQASTPTPSQGSSFNAAETFMLDVEGRPGDALATSMMGANAWSGGGADRSAGPAVQPQVMTPDVGLWPKSQALQLVIGLQGFILLLVFLNLLLG